MRNPFNRSAPSTLSAAEQALQSWGIEYQKQPDGSLLVPEDLDISNKGLTRLPDLSGVTVGGFFYPHKQGR